ncbi:MAG: calcineurin-like phosphoesterase C-terminal domain-containing protein [Alistipes sp.]|nr:calcineurin-like phosphoesterase C-terminal domain-containing protein [Alistipes sp.]
MKRTLLLVVALMWCTWVCVAEVRTLKGTVKCDGKGVAAVVVTDGESFTQTDEKGRFTLHSADDNTLVYITIPAGYEVAAEDSVPQFWQQIEPTQKSYDFELRRKAQDDTHHGFVVMADPQIWHKKEFPALQAAMDDIRKTVEGYTIPFHGICCGDVISYDHTFYPTYNAITASSGLTVFSTPGNHDMTLYSRSHETSTRLWEETFGPVCYSFNVGKAHYVVLNDNFYIGRDYFYIGYLDERQFAWLEKDLSYVEEGSTVFVVLHIPSTCDISDRQQFKYGNISDVMTNARALHQMLSPYKAHILSGHTHTTFNQIINEQLYEHVMPALSGAWWQGQLCTDGTPRGYGVFEVEGDKVQWYYKSTDHTADHQMTLYSGVNYPQFEGQVVANVWAVDEKWQIEARFDGGDAMPMERFSAYDPGAQAMYADRSKLDHPYVYPSLSDHFFRVVIPEGAKQVVITATDPFGRSYSETLSLK